MINGDVNYLKTAVELNSYGTSPNFLGFCSHKQLSTITSLQVDTIINKYIVYNALKHLEPKLATSLFIDVEYVAKQYRDKDDSLLTEGTIQQLLDPLNEKGWLRYVEYKDYPEESDWQKLMNNLVLHEGLDDFHLQRICQVTMTLPGIRGHCFFLYRDLELIIYPHDEVGFGILAPPNSMGQEIGLEFLKSMELELDMIVTVKRPEARYW